MTIAPSWTFDCDGLAQFYKHKNIYRGSSNFQAGLLLRERIIKPRVIWNTASWNLRGQDVKSPQACLNTMHRVMEGMDGVLPDTLGAELKRAYCLVHALRKLSNIRSWTDELADEQDMWPAWTVDDARFKQCDGGEKIGCQRVKRS